MTERDPVIFGELERLLQYEPPEAKEFRLRKRNRPSTRKSPTLEPAPVHVKKKPPIEALRSRRGKAGGRARIAQIPNKNADRAFMLMV